MVTGDPQMLISRHVNRLMERSEKEILEVLRRVDLVRTGGIVHRADERPMSFEDCFRYKQAVKEVLGQGVYDYAKVNFALGGCRCPDCETEGRQE